MTLKATATFTAILSVGMMLAASALAEQEVTTPKANPVGVGAPWNAHIDEATVTGRTFDASEMGLIEQINNYFNDLQHLQGRFVQTDWQNQRVKGKFYVRRPGRFRFIYSPPSKLVILSDGRYLSIEDYAEENVERYPLDATPFRLLLGESVDILRDARVLNIYNSKEVASVTLEDKSGDGSGRIKLYFSKDDRFELKEWIITDAQGLDTRIEVAKLEFGKQADPRLFLPSKIGLPGIESRR